MTRSLLAGCAVALIVLLYIYRHGDVVLPNDRNNSAPSESEPGEGWEGNLVQIIVQLGVNSDALLVALLRGACRERGQEWGARERLGRALYRGSPLQAQVPPPTSVPAPDDMQQAPDMPLLLVRHLGRSISLCNDVFDDPSLVDRLRGKAECIAGATVAHFLSLPPSSSLALSDTCYGQQDHSDCCRFAPWQYASTTGGCANLRSANCTNPLSVVPQVLSACALAGSQWSGCCANGAGRLAVAAVVDAAITERAALPRSLAQALVQACADPPLPAALASTSLSLTMSCFSGALAALRRIATADRTAGLRDDESLAATMPPTLSLSLYPTRALPPSLVAALSPSSLHKHCASLTDERYRQRCSFEFQ